MENNNTILPINTWLPSSQQPLVIAGPCSAESRQQILNTAKALALDMRVKVFRAGIWKPRTRPSEFEGVGAKGLEWMNEVKRVTGLLTAVEVATPDHIQQSMKAGIDILWIGARTVVNPFMVQELADALEGCDVPVLVKNPLNPDVKLWIGAIERFNKKGIRRIAAVHRGFYFYKHSLYRNQPMWEIPIDMQRQMPELPIICDPSHICGKRDLLYQVSQKALDLGMSGLMIESHINPSNAFTDAEQQLTPVDLIHLLDHLIVRSNTGNQAFESQLELLRREIDKMDAELIDIIGRRMRIVDEIGQFKLENNITILQIQRWRDIFSDRVNLGDKLGLRQDFILSLLQLIHQESIRRQELIMGLKETESE